MKKLIYSLSTLLIFLFVLACTDHEIFEPEPETLSSEIFVSGLKYPIGLAADDKENLWVTEAGSGMGYDGSVSMISPSGVKTTFVTGLQSLMREGSIEGIAHVGYRAGKIYFLHGSNGILYSADVSSFKTGDSPVKLADIDSTDIGSFVESLGLTNPINSNTYDFTFGPDDHMYIIDAGSNAVIKRNILNDSLSLFAKLPNVATGVEAVPTGIVFDGTKFLISTLTGFPFTQGDAKIFQVKTSGEVDVYRSKFTTLTGITLSANQKPIVIQHGVFGAMGFGPKSGKVLNEDGKILLDSLSRPTDIIRGKGSVYYLLSYQDGTISKLAH